MAGLKTIEMIAKDATSELKDAYDEGFLSDSPAVMAQANIRTAVEKYKMVLCNAYLVCVVKSFTNLDLARGTFLANYTLVCYIEPNGCLTPRMVTYLATHMGLRFDDQAGQPMTDPIMGEWDHNGIDFIKFSVRRSQEVLIPIQEQIHAVRNYPFDSFELQLRFELSSVWIPSSADTDPTYKGDPEAACKIRFVTHVPKDVKMGFHRGVRAREAVDRLPEYQIDFPGRRYWGEPKCPDDSQPVTTYSVEVARISLNVMWTTFFPMFATQALLVLLHTVEKDISIGDMATIMLALFAFLTSARDKIPVFPQASVLDKMVFIFVLQLIFVCIDLLYEYFFPWNSADARPTFLIISTAGFGLQLLYVAFRWCRSGLSNGSKNLVEKGHDTRTHEFRPEDWNTAKPREL